MVSLRFVSTILLFAFLHSGISAQQANKENTLNAEAIKKLESQISQLQSSLIHQKTEIKELRESNLSLAGELNAQKELIINQGNIIKDYKNRIDLNLTPTINNLETVNAEHGKTLSEVSSSLNGKYTYLLILLALALIFLPIITAINGRRNLKKGLSSAQTNWDKFQEYILRNK